MIFGGQFKIALCQLSVTADKERNIAHAKKSIEEAAGKGAKLIVLPVSCAQQFSVPLLFKLCLLRFFFWFVFFGATVIAFRWEFNAVILEY